MMRGIRMYQEEPVRLALRYIAIQQLEQKHGNPDHSHSQSNKNTELYTKIWEERALFVCHWDLFRAARDERTAVREQLGHLG